MASGKKENDSRGVDQSQEVVTIPTWFVFLIVKFINSHLFQVILSVCWKSFESGALPRAINLQCSMILLDPSLEIFVDTLISMSNCCIGRLTLQFFSTRIKNLFNSEKPKNAKCKRSRRSSRTWKINRILMTKLWLPWTESGVRLNFNTWI